MANEAVEFLQELIRIDSTNPPGSENNVTKKLAERCDETGIPYKMTNIESNRSNFEMSFNNEAKEKVIFCGHMDTVLVGEQPWEYAPFSGELVGENLYGRGASDMKSGLAAMFLAVESLFQEKRELSKEIVFLATAGEEVDSCGARQYLQEDDMSNVEALVIGEPTNEKVAAGHKGALWVEVITIGQTAHGAMPDQGINAVEWMGRVILIVEALKLDWKISKPPLGESSVSANKMEGGVQTNVIPDRCTLNIDIRTVAPQSHEQLFAELKQKLTDLFSEEGAPAFEMNELLNRPSILTDQSSPIITEALRIKGQDTDSVYGVSYYTDGAVLNPESAIPTLIYGPGNEKLAHQPNEYVNVDAYLRSIDFYKQLILEYAT
ncbi:M20 family metallopeptidase [Lentibacillus amyloliquefaciens]|uniref:Acetylornithine deacetylase n=1 Tax=Lentibacillus amyloliquefaciens TaxID=1472767 RepID=A0A0U4EI05_9BACI|nr:M20 family metallopeptidase [Lentibacillus amyloliquefaciens]ALX50105.1 acetylornithine deacetylase [Lentibacillus amyloliquefaciens]